jgi:rubrerythrin
MATRAESDTEALELAIRAEKDSILFYYQMREIMPQRAQPTVNKIIAEEKSHLRQLSELKRKLAAL